MLTNRIKHFITNFSLNRKLNRENFNIKKQKYAILLEKNRKNNKSYHNHIVKRNFKTENIDIHYVKQPNRDPKKFFGFAMVALGVYILDGKFKVID